MTQDVLQQAIALNNELQILRNQKEYLNTDEDQDDEGDTVPRKKFSTLRGVSPSQQKGSTEFITYKGVRLMLAVLFDTTELIALYETKLDQQIATVIGKIEAL